MRSGTVPAGKPGEMRTPSNQENLPASSARVASAETSRRDLWFALLLIAATFLAYQPAWNGAAVFDDHDHLTPAELQSLEGLGRIWSEFGVVPQYYPVFHSAFWFQCKLWGHAMLGYHLVNVALHSLCAVLLLRVLRRLEIRGAWLAAALFALHPVMVESVAWVSEQKNTLSAAFYLGAALAYLRFDRTRAWTPYVAAFGLFGAGLLSKSVVASLPAALLVIFWWRRGTLSWKKDAQPLLPFFFAALLMGALTIWMEKKFIGATGDDFALSLAQRCLIAGRAIWFYLGKLAWPSDLAFVYSRWTVSAGVGWQYLFPLAALLLLAVAWRIRHRSRAPLAALLFFGGTLVPALGFVNVYPFRYSFVADHYQYLASLGPIVLAAACGTVLVRKITFIAIRPRSGAAMGGVLLIVLGALTWRQSGLYRDEETLWRATAARTPACFVAHSNLGNLYLQQGRIEESIRASEKALELRPHFTDAIVNLGSALRQQGRTGEAIVLFQKALALQPGFAAAHYNLGLALVEAGRTDDALVHLREAVSLRPRFAMARTSLGKVLLGRGDLEESLVQFQQAAVLDPGNADAYENLGSAELQKGGSDNALRYYRKALELQPDHANSHYNLGVLLAGKGEVGDAMRHYERALERLPDFAEAHNNLGVLLLKQGRADEAVRHCETAVRLRGDFAEARYNLGFCLFKAGRLERAIVELEMLVQLHPSIVPGRELLARVRAAEKR